MLESTLMARREVHRSQTTEITKAGLEVVVPSLARGLKSDIDRLAMDLNYRNWITPDQENPRLKRISMRWGEDRYLVDSLISDEEEPRLLEVRREAGNGEVIQIQLRTSVSKGEAIGESSSMVFSINKNGIQSSYGNSHLAMEKIVTFSNEIRKNAARFEIRRSKRW